MAGVAKSSNVNWSRVYTKGCETKGRLRYIGHSQMYLADYIIIAWED